MEHLNELSVLRKLAAVLIGSILCGTSAFAGWQIPAQPQARAEIVYTDNGSTPFDLMCAHNIVLYLKYPGKETSGNVTIAISNGKKTISVNGSLEKSDSGTLQFVAAWTGKSTDPADQDAVMALFTSGLPLTFSAEGAQYELPAVDAATWSKYNNAC